MVEVRALLWWAPALQEATLRGGVAVKGHQIASGGSMTRRVCHLWGGIRAVPAAQRRACSLPVQDRLRLGQWGVESCLCSTCTLQAKGSSWQGHLFDTRHSDRFGPFQSFSDEYWAGLIYLCAQKTLETPTHYLSQMS